MRYEAIAELRPERDVLRCLLESPEAKQSLIAHQGALGIGAYDAALFVGSLWFYRVEDRDRGAPLAPDWSGWCPQAEEFRALAPNIPDEAFPLLGLDCFHVGRTKALEDADVNDESFYGRGIGSELLRTACAWAAERDYRSVVGASGIDVFPEFNNWAGKLPLKVYLRNGFDVLVHLDARADIPGHLRAEAQHIEQTKLARAGVIKRIRREAGA